MVNLNSAENLLYRRAMPSTEMILEVCDIYTTSGRRHGSGVTVMATSAAPEAGRMETTGTEKGDIGPIIQL